MKRALIACAALLMVVVLLAVLSRITTPSSAQREAQALMERDDLPNGPDAYALLWSLEYDVPLDEIDAVLAADVATVENWPLYKHSTWSRSNTWRKEAFPSLAPTDEDLALFCDANDEIPCLDKVRSAPEDSEAALARANTLLVRAMQVRGKQVLRDAMPPKVNAPIVGYRYADLPMTAHALAFVRGEEAFAIAETCRDISTWRRLAVQGDSLLGAMVGIAYAGRSYAPLLADMLEEWPVDRPLPEDCDLAIATPGNDELLLCNAIRGEHRNSTAIQRALNDESRDRSLLDAMWLNLMWDEEATIALTAEYIAPYCLTGQPGQPEYDWQEPDLGHLLRWSCLGNIGGCSAAALSRAGAYGAYGDYAERMVDFGARLRLLGALVWMREEMARTGEDAASLMKRLPPEFSEATPPVELTPDGETLRVPLFDQRWGKWAEVSAPARP